MNTISFAPKDIMAILSDITASLDGGFAPEHIAGRFAGLSQARREQIVGQLLFFFDCSEIHDCLRSKSHSNDIAAILSAHLNRKADKQLCFKTSGSTGQPVIHRHFLSALALEAQAFLEHASAIKRVVSVVPRYHLYGCSFAFLLPIILNIEVLTTPLLSAGAIGERLRDGDLLVGFPLFWRNFTESKHDVKRRITGLTSTGPCPADIFAAVKGMGIYNFYEIYGASETGAVGIRADYNDKFELLSHWQKQTEQTLLRTLFPGHSQQLNLADNVAWFDNIHFQPIERIDKAVQVGGVNVYPRAVSHIIEAHPSVKHCRVRLMDGHEGHRLKAFVVPAEPSADSQQLRQELKQWCRQRLIPAQRPKSFSFGKAITRNELGKDANWRIKDNF
jgi:4-coumarate--CoA ligase (photoactive yellow protein activation family)